MLSINREFNITRHFSFLVLILTLSLVSFVPLFGQLVEEKLMEQTMSATGRFASMEFTVAIDPSHADPRLNLNFQSSSLLNASRSKLTLYVDNQPRKSIQLLGTFNTVMVPLAEKVGFQKISVRTSLVIDNDSCLTSHPEGAWLSILDSSSFAYRKKVTSSIEKRALTVANLPEGWESGSAVNIQYFGIQSKASVLSQIDWNHRLRSWNFVPSNRADTSRYFVRIFESGQSGIPDSLDLELAEHDDIQAVMRVNGNVLNLVVDKPESASRAALMISDYRARDLCTGSLCKLGPEFTFEDVDRSIPESREDEWAARLDQLGYPNGWTARGDGTSTLRLYWEKPPWWELLRYPELRMQVRKSGTGGWAEDLPALSIRINGQPIASFSLSSIKSNLANVTARIPAHFWDATGWSIEIDAHLEQDNPSCAFSESEHSWLVIEPESGLFIPRKELEFDGISNLFLSNQEPPPLIGDLEIVDRNLELVSNLLYPFRPNVDRSFEWPNSCSGHCFRIVEGTQLAAFDKISLDDGIHTLDKNGELRSPVLLTSSSTQIVRSKNDYLAGLPKDYPNKEILIPDYRALKSSYAIHFDDQWIAIESADSKNRQIQVGEAQLVAGVESSQGQQLRLIHLFIGLLLAILVGVGAIWLWRGFRMYNRDELDGKNIEHFG